MEVRLVCWRDYRQVVRDFDAYHRQAVHFGVVTGNDSAFEAEQIWTQSAVHGLNDTHAISGVILRRYNNDWPYRARETAVSIRRIGCGRCTKN